MKFKWFNKNYITVLIVLSFASSKVWSVEFNTDILDAEDKQHIDFSRFSYAGYIMPGTYQVQVLLNGDNVGQDISIPFYPRENIVNSVENEKNIIPEACISPQFVNKMGLTDSAVKKIGTWHDGECADFSSLEGVTITPHLSDGTLAISVPQAWLEYSDATWLPSSRWEHGIPGILIDYNTNLTVRNNNHKGVYQSGNINGSLGMNAGAWRLRSDYQGYYTNSTEGLQSPQKQFSFTRTYLYRPLPSIRSKLIMGEIDVVSDIRPDSSWRYMGFSLASDDSMLPPRLRGYAPEVTGVAQTNAQVTISQDGRILYDSTVPAGPFRIQSLDSSVRGRLDVKITEQNGEVHTYSVYTASVPYLTRPGHIRYKLWLGRPSTWEHHIEGPMFASTELSWGITNAWSVFGNINISDKYKSFTLGAGRDLAAFGTLAFDITQANAELKDKNLSGKSWRIAYSKRFDNLNTDITFAGYRFNEKDYMTMPQFLESRYRDIDVDKQKERYEISVVKSFNDYPLSLNINYQEDTYWDRGATTGYQAGVSSSFNLPKLNLFNIFVSLNAGRTQFLGKNNDSISLNVSMPLGNGRVSYFANYYQGSRYNHSASYTEQLDVNNSYSLQANLSHGGNNPASSGISALYNYRGSSSDIGINAAIQNNEYSMFGLNSRGGITITGKGAAMHNGGFYGSTRLMIDTDGVAGIPVNGGRVVTNAWGIGVIPDVNSYYRTTARVDLNKLPENIEVPHGVIETALTEGAIGYKRLEVLKGLRIFAVLRLPDGSYPPFGTSVQNKKGREIGIVSDAGLVWLTGVEPEQTLRVSWGGQEQCQVHIPSAVTEGQRLLLPCHSNVVTNH